MLPSGDDMGRKASYEGGAWSVGGAMSAHRAQTSLEEQHADKLAAWFHATARAADDPIYAKMAHILEQEIAEIEKLLAAPEGAEGTEWTSKNIT